MAEKLQVLIMQSGIKKCDWADFCGFTVWNVLSTVGLVKQK